MSRTPGEWSPESDDPDRWFDPTAFYITFLSDHDQAAAAGRPLLTAAGVEYLQCRLERERSGADTAESTLNVGRPRWDAVRRQLWLGGRLLREFRRSAPRQAAVLAAFEARGWVADPVPNPLRRAGRRAARWLHETVKNLNRRLPPGTIRFRDDPVAGAVWWE